MLNLKIYLLLISLIYQTLQQSCKVDKDCDSIALKSNPLPMASLGAYLCVKGKCEYAVKPGELCMQAQDCASYIYLSRHNTSTSLLNNICDSSYCTLESNCDGAWDISGAPELTTKLNKCCGGINSIEASTNTCPLNGLQNMDVCSKDFSCAKAEGKNEGQCETAAQHYQTWIGVVLVLLGGSLLNFGLNLQKFALNRHDRREKEKNGEINGENVDPNTSTTRVNSGQNLSPDGSTVISEEENTTSHVRQKSRMSLESRRLERTFSSSSKAVSMAKSIGHGAVTFKDKIAKVLSSWRSSVISPLYIVGLLIYIGASGLNFVALQFAPQSLVGPLGSVSLITNIILAPLMNKEKLGKTDFIGIALIIGGCVMVVFFAGIVQHDYRLCVLYSLFSQTPTIIYLTLIFSLLFLTFCYIKVVEKNLDNSTPTTPVEMKVPEVLSNENIAYSAQVSPIQNNTNRNQVIAIHKDQSNSIEMKKKKSETSTHRLKKSRKCRLFDPDHSIFDFMIPTMKNRITRTSKHYKYFLPIAYAGLGSLMATLTTLFAKTLINLLSVSIFQGDNQFNNWLPWIILLFVAFTAFSQVYWIMLGLRRYDALLQVPVFYVIWTVFDIIGGGVYFNEFRDFTPLKYGMFCLGVAIIFTGVAVLAHRMSRIK